MNTLLWLNALSVRIDGGFPWTRVYVSHQLSDVWYVFGEYEQASLKRVHPSVGMSMKWVDQKWDVHGDVLLGGVIQNAQISKQGPSAELRVVAYKSEGTVRPWTRLGVKESLFVDQWIIETNSGIENQYHSEYELMLTGALGMDFVFNDWTVGVAMDLPWVDVPTPTIPGVHLSVGKGVKIR